jgi:hypothetical protein
MSHNHHDPKTCGHCRAEAVRRQREGALADLTDAQLVAQFVTAAVADSSLEVPDDSTETKVFAALAGACGGPVTK